MKNRNTNLDLIRCVAVMSVLSVHFFLNSGFYSEAIVGKKMYIATMLRSTFMVCVPLFIMLSGYLMNKKKLSLQYFLKIKKVIVIYVLSTIVILLYKMFILGEEISLLIAIHNITSFQQYSWYVEMYIGLYLIIPFLNLIYNNLEEKKDKQLLIGILLCLTTVPSMINTFGYSVVPDWWTNIYPLTYYFLGAYLCEYGKKIKLSIKWNAILMIAVVWLSGTYSYMRSYKQTYIWGAWCDWGGIMTCLTTVCLFVLLLRINQENWHKGLLKIIRKISEVSLPVYLCSWIWDIWFYNLFNSYVENVSERVYYFVPVVMVVFTGSFICGYIIDCIYKRLDQAFSNLRKK